MTNSTNYRGVGRINRSPKIYQVASMNASIIEHEAIEKERALKAKERREKYERNRDQGDKQIPRHSGKNW